jgi:RES domain-containing protein
LSVLIKPEWSHYRVVHSRFPPVNLFEEADSHKANLLAELEGYTSDRLHRWNEFVTETDLRLGDGWSAVMAAFCYSSPSRFNTEYNSAYYCADSHKTALMEWSHHAAKIWRSFNYTDEASAVVRCYVGKFDQALVDLRQDGRAHDPDSYTYSQSLANGLRKNNVYGVLYHSVRNAQGECAALFRPPAATPVKQSSHYTLQWNGKYFVAFAKMGDYESLE